MKILKIKAFGYRNCKDGIELDFIPRSKKTEEDKEYELQEIDENLYVYNTAAIIGKNASGKTSVIELIDCCYDLMSDFRLENKNFSFEGIKLEIIFYHESIIYKYLTDLKQDKSDNKANFSNQELYFKPYYKSKVNKIFDDDFVQIKDLSDLPEDTSILFFILKSKQKRGIFFNCFGDGSETYVQLFKALKAYDIDGETLKYVIKIFDENIQDLEKLDEHNYYLTYRNKLNIFSDKELFNILSSGTTKGLLLYITAAASLEKGFDLIIDEIENHFHKTLVENLISLYKDKNTNRHNASLIFTTHYCELLDLFNRMDNIWISKCTEEVELFNMYTSYNQRFELLKSKRFYSNAFGTAVNYERLMDLKRVLMQ